VWAQEHLLSAGYPVVVDGAFGRSTQTAVRLFQLAGQLPVTGHLDPTTWAALLHYPTPAITWTLGRNSQLTAQVAARRAPDSRAKLLPVPWSASLRERRDELAGKYVAHAGRPSSARRRFLNR
jgi:peptidoglycan hydrolase-like protein with peptidoglycan-binding domain